MNVIDKLMLRRLFGLKPIPVDGFYEALLGDDSIFESLEDRYQEFREGNPDLSQEQLDAYFAEEKDRTLRDLCWQLAMWDSFISVPAAWKALPYYFGWKT